MSVRTLKAGTGTSYFCTFTCFNWLPLFDITNIHDAVYTWFDHLKENKNHIIGYVIMSNHLHCIIYLKKESTTINSIIGNAKRLLAYAIVNRLKELKRNELLFELENAVSEKEKLKGILHKVFEPSFDGKECFTYDFLQEKLKYMHENPVKAGLVNFPEEYLHSSAKFYLSGSVGVYPVTHFIEVYDGKDAYEFSINIKKQA